MSKKNKTLEVLNRLEKGEISPDQAQALLSPAAVGGTPHLALYLQGQEEALRKVLEKLNEVFSEVKLAEI